MASEPLIQEPTRFLYRAHAGELPPDGPCICWLWRAPGVPARAIPLDMLETWDGETMISGIRPPYWLAAHQVECAVAL